MTGLTLAALAAWDLTGLDRTLAHSVGAASGFPLKDNWVLRQVMHTGARYLSWAIMLLLALSIWWPVRSLRQLTPQARVQLVVTPLVAALTISILKATSATSCPWDLTEFGGVAHYLSHWTRGPDGGPGRCFPAGHASAGFAFIGGYLVFRPVAPALARRWLVASLVAGLALGLAQQWRGAHFMSHTLWTGWICWCVACGMDAAWRTLATHPRAAAVVES